MSKRIVLIGLCGLAVLALGSSPRYLEELRIGGGYGEGVDGGADFDKAGNVWTDGDVVCGDLEVNGGDIGTSDDADLVGLADGALTIRGSLSIPPGTIVAGADDVAAGTLTLHGNSSTVGGRLELYNAAGNDDSVDYWRLHSGTSGALCLDGCGGSSNPGLLAWIDAADSCLTYEYGMSVASGELAVGQSGTRGLISVWQGTGGTAPGCVKLCSANGSARYLFASNDGVGLRIHGSLPTSDTDGTWLAACRFRGSGSTTEAVDLGTAEVSGVLPDAKVSDSITVGSGGDLSGPPAIGGGTPNAGAFTTLSATGDITTDSNLWVGSGGMTAGSEDVENGYIILYGNYLSMGGNLNLLNGALEDTYSNGWSLYANGDLRIEGLGGTSNLGDVLSFDEETGDMTCCHDAVVDGDLTVAGGAGLGDSSTDVLACTGRFLPRKVDDDSMDATAGTEGEIVYNEADNKFYGCTSSGNPATWSGLN